jgi:hypothetical protein
VNHEALVVESSSFFELKSKPLLFRESQGQTRKGKVKRKTCIDDRSIQTTDFFQTIYWDYILRKRGPE